MTIVTSLFVPSHVKNWLSFDTFKYPHHMKLLVYLCLKRQSFKDGHAYLWDHTTSAKWHLGREEKRHLGRKTSPRPGPRCRIFWAEVVPSAYVEFSITHAWTDAMTSFNCKWLRPWFDVKQASREIKCKIVYPNKRVHSVSPCTDIAEVSTSNVSVSECVFRVLNYCLVTSFW